MYTKLAFMHTTKPPRLNFLYLVGRGEGGGGKGGEGGGGMGVGEGEKMQR